MNTDSPGAVLARELTDIPDVVRQVPAPPVPQLAPPSAIRLADADGADAEMVATWMNRPHLVKTWECDWPVERWRSYLRAQLDGAYSVPLILSIKGVDCFYLEAYRAAKDSIAPRYDCAPHDLGLHGAIADEELLNRGLGPLLVPRIAASMFAADPTCEQILFDPEHRNIAMRRLCEFIGCRYLGEHDMSPKRRMALYALDRATISA
jgi:lysine N-acyltransferase